MTLFGDMFPEHGAVCGGRGGITTRKRHKDLFSHLPTYAKVSPAYSFLSDLY